MMEIGQLSQFFLADFPAGTVPADGSAEHLSMLLFHLF